jgi:hypothetical protein
MVVFLEQTVLFLEEPIATIVTSRQLASGVMASAPGGRSIPGSSIPLRRRLEVTTVTEERAMASPANIGGRAIWKAG